MRIIQKLKIQNGKEEKANHCCEVVDHPRPRCQQFPYVFAFKETSDWADIS